MKRKNTDKALESYKIFPYIAWALTIGFAYFVYSVAVDLQHSAERLEAQAKILHQTANTPVQQIEDFDIKRKEQ